MDWIVLVPVKPLAAAKSRLRGAVAPPRHADLALAMALDTVEAAVAAAPVRRVVVVTDDPRVRAATAAVGAEHAPDRPGEGLNGALNAAAGALVDGGAGRAVAGLIGSAPSGLAALPADLPALRPAELSAALAEAATAGPRAYVADADETGTVLLTARGVPLDARFGPDSAARHAASGAVALGGDWPSLRHDVDRPGDLAAVAALGLGRHSRREYGAGMQGTVASFDPDARAGTVLLDDGSELLFGPAAFDASGLRLLRMGQRVKIETAADGEVRRVTLPTLP